MPAGNCNLCKTNSQLYIRSKDGEFGKKPFDQGLPKFIVDKILKCFQQIPEDIQNLILYGIVLLIVSIIEVVMIFVSFQFLVDLFPEKGEGEGSSKNILGLKMAL